MSVVVISFLKIFGLHGLYSGEKVGCHICHRRTDNGKVKIVLELAICGL